MNSHNDEKIRKLLQNTFPPVVDAGPPRDLWPAVLQRLNEAPVRVPWFDWALLAVLAIWFFFSPEAIPILLYHL